MKICLRDITADLNAQLFEASWYFDPFIWISRSNSNLLRSPPFLISSDDMASMSKGKWGTGGSGGSGGWGGEKEAATTATSREDTDERGQAKGCVKEKKSPEGKP